MWEPFRNVLATYHEQFGWQAAGSVVGCIPSLEVVCGRLIRRFYHRARVRSHDIHRSGQRVTVKFLIMHSLGAGPRLMHYEIMHDEIFHATVKVVAGPEWYYAP